MPEVVFDQLSPGCWYDDMIEIFFTLIVLAVNKDASIFFKNYVTNVNWLFLISCVYQDAFLMSEALFMNQILSLFI